MSKRLYVGNLPYAVTREELSAAFEQWGPVESVAIITDHETGESKGFAFIQLADEKADDAVNQMNGTLFKGRPLRVKEARPREQRPFEPNRNARPEREQPWEPREPGISAPSASPVRSDAGRSAESRPGRDAGSRGSREYSREFTKDSGLRDGGGRRKSRDGGRDGYRDGGRDGSRDGGRGRERDRDRWNRDWE
ncbi:MAG TPA: hypothetical protein VFJ58_02440 [Armatimonadota bacterium]|nr:hypothetical protein [Armatimonadota bacterium]